MNRHVGTLSLARFVDAFSNSILIIVLPLYVAQLQSHWLGLPEETLVGILIFSFGIISSFAQPFSGVMSDRLERRKIFIIIGLALMGVSTFVFVLAHKFGQLVLIRAVQGFGFALTIPATFSLMASYTKLENRGGAMGIYSTMRMVGFGLGPLLGGILIVQTGFKTVFYLVGALSLFSTFLVWLLVDDPETVEKNPGQVRPMPKFSDSISFDLHISEQESGDYRPVDYSPAGSGSGLVRDFSAYFCAGCG
ncbi:MAG: MFS transporter [Calditrichota bacterium]